MRAWTVLLVPHDTEEPRSIAVSGRMLRVAAAAAVVVLFAAAIGIGTVAARWARVDRMGASVGSAALLEDGAVVTGGELDSLRATVEALYDVLGTIRQSDARLSDAAGMGHRTELRADSHAAIALTRASADSLLVGASRVADRLVALADSARGRRSPAGTALKGETQRSTPVPASKP